MSKTRSTSWPILLATALLVGSGCAVAPDNPPAPSPSGHLLIVGGGPRPASVMERFVELAGGSGAAIAVIPTASANPERTGAQLVEQMEQLGAARSFTFHVSGDGASSAAAARLDGVTGVWFAGGRQRRVTDALSGTAVEEKLHALYREGAVLGGTSAGAAIMSPLMITGGERRPGGDRPSDAAWITIDRDNVETTPGLGFLPGAIVDQHFVRRRRNNRLLSLVLEYPDHVGVGIDESTAIVVGPDGRWEVVGESVALIYDARDAAITGADAPTLGTAGLRLHVLPDGGVFDPGTGEALLPAAEAGSRATSAPSGSFVFDDTPATRDRPVTVWYHRPAGLASDGPVVFVMHGTLRNGEDYRDQWVEQAETHGFMVVVPELSDEGWPGSRGYNLGNMHDEDGDPLPEEEWAFGVIEDVFDAVRSRFDLERETYSIYGHSAGAQFVHRFLLMAPEARLDAAIPANAGWYTMPDRDVGYPYGLAGPDGPIVSEDRVRDALERPVIILLGEEDNDPEHRYLRRNDQADAQGLHRFARGHAFYEAARERARELDAEFGWRLETVPGVGHSNTRMAPAAAALLQGR